MCCNSRKPSNMQKPVRKKRYSGILNKKVVVPTKALQELAKASNTKLEDEVQDYILMARKLRQKALFRHYKIQEGDFEALVMAMAEHHVPAFSMADEESKAMGRPAKWGGADGWLLWSLVLNTTQAANISVREACDAIAKTGMFGLIDGEVLNTRYHEARRTHPDVIEFERTQKE